MPKILGYAKNILRLREGEEVLLWILHKINVKNIVSQLMFIRAISPLVFCTYKFVLNIFYCFFFIYFIVILSCWPGQ